MIFRLKPFRIGDISTAPQADADELGYDADVIWCEGLRLEVARIIDYWPGCVAMLDDDDHESRTEEPRGASWEQDQPGTPEFDLQRDDEAHEQHGQEAFSSAGDSLNAEQEPWKPESEDRESAPLWASGESQEIEGMEDPVHLHVVVQVNLVDNQFGMRLISANRGPGAPADFDMAVRSERKTAPEAISLLLKNYAESCGLAGTDLDSGVATYDVDSFEAYLAARMALEEIESDAEGGAMDRPALYGLICRTARQSTDFEPALEILEEATYYIVEEQLEGVCHAAIQLDRLFDTGRSTPLLLRLRGVMAMHDDDIEGARKWLRQALSAGDSREACSYHMARCAESLEQWAEMSIWGRALLEEADDDPLYHFIVGVAEHQLGHDDEAAARWRQALTLAPDAHGARVHLAGLLMQQGHDDDALTHLKPLIEQGGAHLDVPILTRASEILGAASRGEEARRLIHEFLAEAVLDMDEQIEVARLLLLLGDETARELLESAAIMADDSDPGDVAQRLLCELHQPGFEDQFRQVADDILSGHGPRHLGLLKEWASLKPVTWQVSYLEAHAVWQSGNLSQASRLFAESAARRPSLSIIHEHWGILLLEMGLFQQAEERLKMALGMDEPNPGLLLKMALVQAYRRRFREALALIREAINLAPEIEEGPAVRKAVLDIWRNPAHPLPRLGQLPAFDASDEDRGSLPHLPAATAAAIPVPPLVSTSVQAGLATAEQPGVTAPSPGDLVLPALPAAAQGTHRRSPSAILLPWRQLIKRLFRRP